MKKFVLFSILALGSTSLSAVANTELTALKRQVALSASRIDRLEAKIAKLQANLKIAPTSQFERRSTISLAPAAKPAVITESRYTIRSGDTISRISRKFKVSAASIIKLNKIRNPSFIAIGTELIIPGSENTQPKITAVATSTPQPKSQPVAARKGNSYTVKTGETLYGISRRTGVPLWKIQAANPKVDSSSLRPGTVLSLNYQGDRPKVAARKAATASTAPAPKKEQRQASYEPKFEDPTDAIRPIKIQRQITYGQFAAKHGTSTASLNKLNGLKLSARTPLAKGSELYVPGR